MKRWQKNCSNIGGIMNWNHTQVVPRNAFAAFVHVTLIGLCVLSLASCSRAPESVRASSEPRNVPRDMEEAAWEAGTNLCLFHNGDAFGESKRYEGLGERLATRKVMQFKAPKVEFQGVQLSEADRYREVRIYV